MTKRQVLIGFRATAEEKEWLLAQAGTEQLTVYVRRKVGLDVATGRAARKRKTLPKETSRVRDRRMLQAMAAGVYQQVANISTALLGTRGHLSCRELALAVADLSAAVSGLRRTLLVKRSTRPVGDPTVQGGIPPYDSTQPDTNRDWGYHVPSARGISEEGDPQ